MVEVGIPVYKAKDTLPNALDSLVCQTRKNFLVCLSIDGDGEDYSDIINTYIARGLKIRVIRSEENGGPGMARQRIIDTTQCDYLMFVDADDMLMPLSVEMLYRGAVSGGYDVIRSGFIREELNGIDKALSATDNIITWFHGKIYRVQYLKQKDIRFLPGLRTDEDAYFNIVACNCTDRVGIIDEFTYIWRDNKNSLTRKLAVPEYFKGTYMNYIRGQVAGMKKIANTNGQINGSLLCQTLINIYYYYMRARFYHLDEKVMDECISEFKEDDWIQEWLEHIETWQEIIHTLKVGDIYEKQCIIFFDEPFNKWAARLLRKE